METIKHSDQVVEIVLTPQDVESAIRQFICTCIPEYNKGWIINPKHQLGSAVFVGTKE
jgi:hypothetical protein